MHAFYLNYVAREKRPPLQRVVPLIDSLFLYIHPLYSCADSRKHLVWYGAKGIAEFGYREVVAEDFDRVAFLAFYVGHINHADIHADVAYVFGRLAIDEAMAVAVAEVAIETVGIADRDGGYATVACQGGATAVAY